MALVVFAHMHILIIHLGRTLLCFLYAPEFCKMEYIYSITKSIYVLKISMPIKSNSPTSLCLVRLSWRLLQMCVALKRTRRRRVDASLK